MATTKGNNEGPDDPGPSSTPNNPTGDPRDSRDPRDGGEEDACCFVDDAASNIEVDDTVVVWLGED
jgi:hypothetical protein